MSYKIAIYAICKNEKKFVNQWMESMLEADYICILDTGSTDGTYELLQEWKNKYPEKIIIDQKEFKPWRFDTPRNESMKLIPTDTDICFCTDLDELLIKGWSEDVRNTWNPAFNRMYYKYAWSHNEDGSPARVFWYNKIHSYGEWLWQYPVHEALYNIKNNETNGVYMDEHKIYLHHYQDDSKTHRGSYLQLLEQRAKEYPDDWYGLVYLAHEYYYQYQDLNCINFILNNVLPKIDLNDDYLCKTDLYMFLGMACQRLNRLEEAEVFYKTGVESEPSYRENYLKLAQLYLTQNKYNECIEIVNKALLKTTKHYSWLEEDESWTYLPYDLLSLAYYYNGQKEVALQFAKIALDYCPQDSRLQENVKAILNNINEVC